jgi:two-component system, OmpR family, response regulator ArlR
MSEADIMIVEDDATIARFVELELTHAGFEVRRTDNGATALELFAEQEPDLMVLDLMLPGMDGLDVARNIREHGSEVPILMLTARATTEDAVTGFEAGADDYLRKPFEIPELLSRIRALLKRTTRERTATTFAASGIEVDTDKRQASAEGTTLDLTAKEFDLLAYLVANAGRVVPRDEILNTVWGSQRPSDSNVIEVFVCHLRNKIGDRDNRVIQTIRGVGYFFARG